MILPAYPYSAKDLDMSVRLVTTRDLKFEYPDCFPSF